MAERTISGGFETYRRASDGEQHFGMQGENVDVHEDDLDRFDRLHPAPVVPEVNDSDVELPEGEPSEAWTGKQLDAYAEAFDIDLGSAKNKPDKVAAILAAQSA
jgi:hypothetical protein